MALTLSYDAHTEVGLVRSNNQDSALVSPRMLVVADGMGGAAAGDLASAVAIREMERTDANLAERIAAARAEREADPVDHDEDAGSLTDVLTVMESTLGRANERLVELVEDDPGLAGMGTTVCGFVLHDDRLAVINIGDSRAYLIRDHQLHRVTRDHSWVQTLVDEGRLTEAEALEHPHRSLVLRVLNGSTQHEPDLGWLEIVSGDRLLVCSDGLCGLATDAELADIATADAERPAVIADLVALAHARGGHDNITILLADVVTDGPPGPVLTLGSVATLAVPTAAETTASLPVMSDPAPEAAGERAITEEERYALTGRRRLGTRVRMLLAFLLPLLALGAGGGIWYSYTQTQYFVGPQDTRVGLFRGVPDRVLGLPLSTLLETDETEISNLPPYYAERVRSNIRVGSLPDARETLVELRQKAAQCVAQREARARATAAPTPTDPPALTADPAVTADPAITAEPALTAGPAVTVGPADTASPGSSSPSAGVTPSVTSAPVGEDC